ncbi:MAG: hypothetical protein AAGH64_09700 [Planctomycetota bacterium]
MPNASITRVGVRGRGSDGGESGYDLSGFEDAGLTRERLASLLDEHEKRVAPMCERLWGYYANEERVRVDALGGVVRERYQAGGLPGRLRRRGAGDDRADTPTVVIENDIAWRVNALVDLAFGELPTVEAEGDDAALVGRCVRAAFEASGGDVFLRDVALLGSVHGWVDLVVRTEAVFERVAGMSRGEIERGGDALAEELAGLVRIEAVSPERGVALVSERDYRAIDAYVIRTRVGSGDAEREVLEVLSDRRRRVFVDGEAESDAANRLGVLPVVHVQHQSVPFRYAGVGEVAGLIALQDELNTRLSDRAHRVTMQSFNMYLAKGLEGVSELAVGPGKVWLTDNPDAAVHAFGGDGHSPSEESHIDELREALDKASGVSPVVLGVVRAKLGHLSSVNALRMTLLGVLTKTRQRRLSYGRGLSACADVVLRTLEGAGALRGGVKRTVGFRWRDALPTTEEERLRSARSKLELGADADEVLDGLGLGAEMPEGVGADERNGNINGKGA